MSNTSKTHQDTPEISQAFEDFLTKVDSHLVKSAMKSRKSGREKAAYEMRCYWYEPKGTKFTFRSDDTLIKLEKYQGIKASDELKALMIKFVAIKSKARQVEIFDNRAGYPGITVFKFRMDKVVINKIKNWN